MSLEDEYELEYPEIDYIQCRYGQCDAYLPQDEICDCCICGLPICIDCHGYDCWGAYIEGRYGCVCEECVPALVMKRITER